MAGGESINPSDASHAVESAIVDDAPAKTTDMKLNLYPPEGERRHTRRLSSKSVEVQDLAFGGAPAVVIPDHLMEGGGDSEDIATAMELARQELEGLSTAEPAHEKPKSTRVTDHYAMAFDIDGVLLKEGSVIPEAVDAIRMLNGHNNHGIKVPYIFVTNGGGKTEAERCIQLSQQLHTEVSPGQFICGHTPMRELAKKYDTVLVIGGEGEQCREAAEEYGFKTVITPGDIIKTRETTTPWRTLTEEEHANSKVRDFDKLNIQAIFVFADSRDWAGDQQIILDVLTSKNGVLGTRSENYDEGPPIYFAHNDIIWASRHESSRLGMGALRSSVEALFQAVTGKKLNSIAFGKPTNRVFEFATRLLQQWRKDTHGIDAPPKTVYFVGDTPDSDIRGTNNFNDVSEETWYSILVRTGVYQSGTTPKYTPRATVDNVLEAVKHAMERELKKELAHKVNGGAYQSLPSTPAIEIPNPTV